MPFYKEEFDIIPTLVTDYGYFVVAEGKQMFETSPGQQVSIFNLSCSRLAGNGFKWNVYPYKMMWQGGLNEAIDNCVSLDGDGMYMVFLNHI